MLGSQKVLGSVSGIVSYWENSQTQEQPAQYASPQFSESSFQLLAFRKHNKICHQLPKALVLRLSTNMKLHFSVRSCLKF